MANGANQNNDNEAAKMTVCTCIHPTHFLGRCQTPVEPPEQLCADCMQNHFNRADDPTI